MRRIREHLEVFEATDLIDKQVGKLSGGELQRVLLTMVGDGLHAESADHGRAGGRYRQKRHGSVLPDHGTHLKEEYDMAIILSFS